MPDRAFPTIPTIPTLPILPMLALALAASLAAAGCSGPGGPVAPDLIEPPASRVTITPELTDFLRVPRAPGAEIVEYTSDNRLRIQFQLTNVTADDFFVRVEAQFVDEAGREVARRGPMRFAFSSHHVETISFTSDSTAAKDVKVQVAPAR